MVRLLLPGAVWVLTLCAAFLLGRDSRHEPDPPQEARRAPAGRARATDAPTAPVLAPAPTPLPRGVGADSEPGRGSPSAGVPGPEAGAAPGPFTLAGAADPDEVMGRILGHVAALLALGEDGHLALLRFLDEHVVGNEELERIVGSNEAAARYLYPWIKFLVQREGQVLDLVETVYETMAETPAKLAEIDDDVLEIFTEGVSTVLPGAVHEERLERFRGLARRILEADESTQPETVRRQRRRIERVLALWAPVRTPEQAFAELQRGALRGSEALEALRRLSPDQLRQLDLGELLVDAVRAGDYRVISRLHLLPLTGRDVAILDAAIVEAGHALRLQDWALFQYLTATHRGSWPAPRDLLESGLSPGGERAGVFASVLRRLQPGRPPTDYVRWVLERYTLPDATAHDLRSAFALGER